MEKPTKIKKMSVNNFVLGDNPLDQIEEIYEYRQTIKTPDEYKNFVNEVRNLVQKMAVEAIKQGPKHCLVAMATGSGKTKVAIDYAKTRDKKQCLLVPTEKLRDRNWTDEYVTWGAQDLSDNTEKYCYASAKKVKDKSYSLAILDEGHNITEHNSQFFYDNEIDKSVLLTATVPSAKKDFAKVEVLQAIGYKKVFELTLDQAVKLGFVAPYEINVIEVPLESSKKTVVGGTKAKPFMTTEQSTYQWLNTNLKKSFFSNNINTALAVNKRMHFIYKLESKRDAAKYFLDNIIPKEDRGLIFASSIEQAEYLCEHTFHSKTDDVDYEKFKSGELDRMSCVKALNEGHNFNQLDFGLVTQLTSKEKDLVQRIGRLVRMRPGHKAKIFIFVSIGTQDEKWLESATSGLDPGSISYYPYKNLKNYTFYEKL